MAKVGPQTPGVSTAWLVDIGGLLGEVAGDGCWCEEMETQPCLPCRATDLVQRAPIPTWNAACEVDHATGRRIQTVAHAGTML